MSQAHHSARELFLTQQVDAGLEGETLQRLCTVCAPADFANAPGDDVFVCDHSYDTAWDVSGDVDANSLVSVDRAVGERAFLIVGLAARSA